MSDTPEQKARRAIDAQLVAAGWLIRDRRHLNLYAGPGVALCETDVEGGFADYMLFVDAKAADALEAKAAGTPLVGVAEQSELYARAALTDFQRWGDPLPFTFESNGDECRFRDLRDPRSRSHFVFGVHRPETLRSLIEQKDTLRTRLQKFPPLPTAGLRECQIEAINGLENSFARQHPRALVQMATGAGKTWTAVTECYRLIKFGGAHRILFLVDRANLGKQAKNEFDLWHSPYTQRRFTDEYIVQRLDGISLEPRAKVVISTIQRLYAALTGKPIDDTDDEHSTFAASGDTDEPRPVGYNPALPPETFDIIIIDECHGSIYNLSGRACSTTSTPFTSASPPRPRRTRSVSSTRTSSAPTRTNKPCSTRSTLVTTSTAFAQLTESGATVERGNHLEKKRAPHPPHPPERWESWRKLRAAIARTRRFRPSPAGCSGSMPRLNQAIANAAAKSAAKRPPNLRTRSAKALIRICRLPKLATRTAFATNAEPTAAQIEAAATALKEIAVKPFHHTDLRALLVELQTRAEITMDHLSPDTIIEGSGYDEERARGTFIISSSF